MKRLDLIKNQLNSPKESVIVENASENNKEIKIVYMNEGLNALSGNLISSVYKTLLSLDADEETKVIILTSKGKAFAAGADIKSLSKTDYAAVAKNNWFLQPLEYISYHITKPIIAAVNGVAYGGGFELALACDIIIASDKAKFAFPEIKLGLFPGAGGSQRLTKLMGYHKSLEYILTAKDIPLNELKSFGVVNEVVESSKLLDHCLALAKTIASFSLMPVQAAKKAVKMALESSLSAGLRSEKFLFEGLFNTEDKKRGIEAFINKKTPEFKNK